MSPLPSRIPQWYVLVAEKMVREGKNFRVACGELIDQVGSLSADELVRIPRTRTFETVLWTERFRWWNEIANTGGLSKLTMVGVVLESLKHLMIEGKYADAIEAALKLAKIQGWVGPENNQVIIANLTAKDIADAKKATLERLKDIIPPNSVIGQS